MSSLSQQRMQRLTGSYLESPDGKPGIDASYRVELPERHSTFMEHNTDSEGGASPLSNGIASDGLASPGLQSVMSEESGEKQMYRTYGPRHSTEKELVPPVLPGYEKEVHHQPQPRRNKRYWIFLIIACITCIVIGLAVGLGVGLTRKSSSPPPAKTTTAPSSGAGPSPDQFLSKVGAFNGSGIALASESFGNGGYGSIVMYFQHHTGQIRQAQLSSNGNWEGGDVTQIVAVDAKNATPIAAVAYARNDTAAWHIFYINVNNTITEVTNSNTTNVWIPGPINALQLQAMDDRNVGLEACWYGSFYSDASYNHSPVPGLNTNTTTGNSSDQTVGIHLWYATNSTSFDSVGWTYGDSTWTQQQTFQGYNGHAGVGCYSWGPGSDTYVFFVNLDNEINILWKDLNTTLTGSASHPIDTWTRSDISIPVFQNSSMGYTNYLYAQNQDLSISGFNVTWAAENTTIPAGQTFTINGAKGLAGTHLSVTALPDYSGGNSLLTFYQTNGTDITEFVRDLDAGQWTSSSVPIPNS